MESSMSREDIAALARQEVLNHLSKENPGRTFSHLMNACGFVRGAYTGDGLPLSRVLDRALQILRKGGSIEYRSGGWHLL